MSIKKIVLTVDLDIQKNTLGMDVKVWLIKDQYGKIYAESCYSDVACWIANHLADGLGYNKLYEHFNPIT